MKDSPLCHFSPTHQYRGDYPFRTLLLLYRQDLGKLGFSLFWYVIKHSPEWIKPIVIANIIDIISNPNTRSLVPYSAIPRC